VPVLPSSRPKMSSSASPVAARLAQYRHRTQAEDDQPGPERPDVDERRAGDHQPAESDENEGHAEAAVPHEPFEPGVDLAADVPSVPAEPKRDGEEDADEDERETGELVVLLDVRLPPRSLALAHARRGLRA